MNKKRDNTAYNVVKTLGCLFEMGIDMNLSELYPSVEFPVSRGTPMLAPLVVWDHRVKWHVPYQGVRDYATPANGRTFSIDVTNARYSFLRGYVKKGKNYLPESIYLRMVWEAFAENSKQPTNKVNVKFEDVDILELVNISEKSLLNFSIVILKLYGQFEIEFENRIVATGKISFLGKSNEKERPNSHPKKGIIIMPTDADEADMNVVVVVNNLKRDTSGNDFVIAQSDIYNEFKMNDYYYKGQFQSITSSNENGDQAKIFWNGNWIAYLDGILQFADFSDNRIDRLARRISNIKKINIYPSQFENIKKSEVVASRESSTVISVGARMENISKIIITDGEIINQKAIVQKFEWMPYYNNQRGDVKEFIQLLVTMVIENSLSSKVNIVEKLSKNSTHPILSELIRDRFEKMPFYKPEITMLKNIREDEKSLRDVKISSESLKFHSNVHMAVLHNPTQRDVGDACETVTKNGFALLLTHAKTGYEQITIPTCVKLCCNYVVEDTQFSLFHKVSEVKSYDLFKMTRELTWIPRLQETIKTNNKNRIILLSEESQTSGILGFFSCIRRETNAENMRCFFIPREKDDEVCENDKLLSEQIEKDLVVNVFRDGSWGCYVPLLENLKKQDEDECKKRFDTYKCEKGHSYVIYGGLGGMGFEVANWLVLRGANKLVLVSRSSPKEFQKRRIRIWENAGVVVTVIAGQDVTESFIRSLLVEAQERGPVGGIFNCALVLRDAAFENQTEKTFQEVINCKGTATALLDQLSRQLCPQLNVFVVFSSIACGYGNAGQTNYGMANSITERICEIRKKNGFPALAIEWAGVDDVGYMMRRQNDAVSARSETDLQRMESCLEVMEKLLLSKDITIASSFVLSSTENRAKENEAANSSLLRVITNVLGKTDLSEVDSSLTLENLGVDSIATAEMKLILEQRYDIYLSSNEISALSLDQVLRINETKMRKASECLDLQKLSILGEIYSNLVKIMKNVDVLNLEPIVRLPSLLENGDTTEKPINVERTYIVFPSVEGLADVMSPLSKAIDCQVLCCQYDMGLSSIPEIVQSLLPCVKTRLLKSERFHIVGYSFGGLIAMEIVKHLENEGYKGELYLIDSSPLLVKQIGSVLYEQIPFQENILTFLKEASLIRNEKLLREELRRFDNFDEALDYAINEIKSKTKNHAQIRATLKAFQARSKAMTEYDGVKELLASQVTLFQAKQIIIELPSHSYIIDQYCEKPAMQHVVEGNHFTILNSHRLAFLLMQLNRNNYLES